MVWQAASGRGQISSWTIVHKAWFPAFKDETPYARTITLNGAPRSHLVTLMDAAILMENSAGFVFGNRFSTFRSSSGLTGMPATEFLAGCSFFCFCLGFRQPRRMA